MDSRAKAVHSFQLDVQEAAQRLAEGDVDTNCKFDFEEFCSYLPYAVRRHYSMPQLKDFFAAVNRNGGGDITIDEFFVWTIAHATIKLQQIFAYIFGTLLIVLGLR